MKRFSVGFAIAGLTAAAALGLGSTPAFATTLLTCTAGSGTATFTPGISKTPTQQTISSNSTVSGCSGSGTTINGGSISVTGLKTLPTGNPPQQASCGGLAKTSPAGTVIASGGHVAITWSDGTTSAGSVKLKSNGQLGQAVSLIKITSGTFFAAGHVTKFKSTVTYSIPTGQMCPTLTQVNFSQVGNSNVTQS